MATLDLHMPSAMRNVTMTIRITGQREFRIRTWVAVRLMAVAAVVLGCNIAVEMERS